MHSERKPKVQQVLVCLWDGMAAMARGGRAAAIGKNQECDFFPPGGIPVLRMGLGGHFNPPPLLL